MLTKEKNMGGSSTSRAGGSKDGRSLDGGSKDSRVRLLLRGVVRR